ncbi:hypothetical protein Goarm_016801, partial [Gossypium armourianum]|nr:hypothetical protein [Gossypium armourianum]
MTIEAEDGQSLLSHFKVKESEDPMFFWRDGRSRIDYDCFGDVVVFDKTYRTNRYNLICAPFVVARWRSFEAEKDFQCRNGSITCAIKNCGILSHVLKVYTHEIYRCFEKVFLDGVPLVWREVAQNGTSYTFEVMTDENSSRVRRSILTQPPWRFI